jgi:hypothetical protein
MKQSTPALAVFILSAIGSSYCPGQLTLDPNQPYMSARSNPATYDVDFAVVVTPPYKCKLLKVWFPLPPSDIGQEVSQSRLNTFPLRVEPRTTTEESYGNKFAYFEFAGAQGAQLIRHQFRITVWELHWDLDRTKINQVAEWPESFAPYLRSESNAVLVDDRFRTLAQEIIPTRTGPLDEMSTLMDWVIRDFKYDHN